MAALRGSPAGTAGGWPTSRPRRPRRSSRAARGLRRAPDSTPGPSGRRSPGPASAPGGARPSFGSGRRRHRLPQPLREVAAEADALDPDHRDRVLEVVDHAVDRPPLRPDREGCSMSPKIPSAAASARSWSSSRFRGVSSTPAAAAVRAEDRRACGADPLEHLREDAARGVREVEDHAERDEAVDELAAEPREAPALLGGAVGERVPAVPRQPGHPDAERVEDVRGPRLDAEALDALEREQRGRCRSPASTASRSAAVVTWTRGLRSPAARVERRDQGQRLAQRALRLHARRRRRRRRPGGRRRRARGAGARYRAKTFVSPSRRSR